MFSDSWKFHRVLSAWCRKVGQEKPPEKSERVEENLQETVIHNSIQVEPTNKINDKFPGKQKHMCPIQIPVSLFFFFK